MRVQLRRQKFECMRGGMHWKVGFNTVNTLKFEKGGGA